MVIGDVWYFKNLVKMFESLKGDVRFTFSSSGMEIRMIDRTTVAILIHSRKAADFKRYECPKTTTVSVRLKMMRRIISKEDKHTIKLANNAFMVFNSKGTLIDSHHLCAIEPYGDDLEIPEDASTIATVNFEQFKKSIRGFNTINGGRVCIHLKKQYMELATEDEEELRVKVRIPTKQPVEWSVTNSLMCDSNMLNSIVKHLVHPDNAVQTLSVHHFAESRPLGFSIGNLRVFIAPFTED